MIMDKQFNIHNIDLIPSSDETFYYTESAKCNKFTYLMKLVLCAKYDVNILDRIKNYLIDNTDMLNKTNEDGYTAIHIAYLNIDTYSSREIYELLLHNKHVIIDNCVIDKICLLNTIIDKSLTDKHYLVDFNKIMDIATLSVKYQIIFDIKTLNKECCTDKTNETYKIIFIRLLEKLLYIPNTSAFIFFMCVMARHSICSNKCCEYFVNLIITHPNFNKYCNMFHHTALYYLFIIVGNDFNKGVITNFLSYNAMFKHANFKLFNKFNTIEFLMSAVDNDIVITEFLNHPNFDSKIYTNFDKRVDIIINRVLSGTYNIFDVLHLYDKHGPVSIAIRKLAKIHPLIFDLDNILTCLGEKSLLFLSKFNLVTQFETFLDEKKCNYNVDLLDSRDNSISECAITHNYHDIIKKSFLTINDRHHHIKKKLLLLLINRHDFYMNLTNSQDCTILTHILTRYKYDKDICLAISNYISENLHIINSEYFRYHICNNGIVLRHLARKIPIHCFY